MGIGKREGEARLPTVSTESIYYIPEGYVVVSEEDLEAMKHKDVRNGYLEGFRVGYDRGYEDGTTADDHGWLLQ